MIYRHVDDIQTLREMLCFGRVLLVHNRFHVRTHLLHRLNGSITVCIPNILHSDSKLKVLSKIRLSGILAYPKSFSNRRVQGVRINEEVLYLAREKTKMLANFEKLCSYNVSCKPLSNYDNGHEYTTVSTRFFVRILTFSNSFRKKNYSKFVYLDH